MPFLRRELLVGGIVYLEFVVVFFIQTVGHYVIAKLDLELGKRRGDDVESGFPLVPLHLPLYVSLALAALLALIACGWVHFELIQFMVGADIHVSQRLDALQTHAKGGHGLGGTGELSIDTFGGNVNPTLDADGKPVLLNTLLELLCLPDLQIHVLVKRQIADVLMAQRAARSVYREMSRAAVKSSDSKRM